MAWHINRCPLHAWAVDVEVDDGVVAQLVPVRVGVPSRARIAPMAVAWPPGKTNAIPQFASERLEHARKLEQAGVTRNVVGRAVEPGAVVRSDEREFALATPQLGGRQTKLAPALEGIRNECRAHATLFQRGNNGVAVGLGDRDYGHAGDAVDLVEFRRTPDWCDDHFVPLLA